MQLTTINDAKQYFDSLGLTLGRKSVVRVVAADGVEQVLDSAEVSKAAQKAMELMGATVTHTSVDPIYTVDEVQALLPVGTLAPTVRLAAFFMFTGGRDKLVASMGLNPDFAMRTKTDLITKSRTVQNMLRLLAILGVPTENIFEPGLLTMDIVAVDWFPHLLDAPVVHAAPEAEEVAETTTDAEVEVTTTETAEEVVDGPGDALGMSVTEEDLVTGGVTPDEVVAEAEVDEVEATPEVDEIVEETLEDPIEEETIEAAPAEEIEESLDEEEEEEVDNVIIDDFNTDGGELLMGDDDSVIASEAKTEDIDDELEDALPVLNDHSGLGSLGELV